tara:strand:+ start:45552 stop:45728 length:177 start_codon:yes stop_codon:yes gene_type:complete
LEVHKSIGTTDITALGSIPAVLLTYAGYAIKTSKVLVSIAHLTINEEMLKENLISSLN